MSLYPQQSFEHTLKEISVNRNDPCEIVRELVSNSYDAFAKSIYIMPLYSKKGIIFFDDGIGLSSTQTSKESDVLSYVAFFSIGKGTKTLGGQIGYKCQGSKLCFASRKFSLITRCQGEKNWRWMSVTNPKSSLNEKYDITPEKTAEPWKVIPDKILACDDTLTRDAANVLNEAFFKDKFTSGLMIFIEDIEVDNFDKYFSVEDGKHSYLREYIKFHTAHADVRRITDKSVGFRTSEITQLKKHVKPIDPCRMYLWTSTEVASQFVEIQAGWPYLPIPQKDSEDSQAQSPEIVPRLRDGTFYARHADSFKYLGSYYNIVLAIDGKRRALKQYNSLSRQSDARSGIKFSDQRGIILCSHGIRVCQYNQLLDHPNMNEWSDLGSCIDHFVLFIDGPFELVTNRNMPAQNAVTLLRESAFVRYIKQFLDRVVNESGGHILKELRNRIRSEATSIKESEYTDKQNSLKGGVRDRQQFQVQIPGSNGISQKWFVAPIKGEEHFIGALYILLSCAVENDSKIKHLWPRPLTFKSLGIDSIAAKDENEYLRESQLLCVEYKYSLSPHEDFNHPLTITDVIICWTYEQLVAGNTIADTFGFQATVGNDLVHEGKKIGFMLIDIRDTNGSREREHEVKVMSLEKLINACFSVKIRNPVRLNPIAKKRAGK